MARTQRKKNSNNQPTNLASNAPWDQSDHVRQVYSTHPQVSQEYTAPKQNFQVDSWRSYRSDTSNLQSLWGYQSTLNATATDFVPSIAPQQHYSSSFAPYQPLRISNGSTERAAVGLNQAASRTYSTAFASRYPQRSIIQATAQSQDEPLPSIEDTANYDPQPFLAAVQKIRDEYQPPDLRAKKTPSAAAQANLSSRGRTPQKTISPPPPQITDEYLADASNLPRVMPAPKKLLVILDLNGTLLFRKRSKTQLPPYMRPGVTPLLEYLFKNHAVMIYTSAMPESASVMIKAFLHPSQRNSLVAVWARDKLDLNAGQFHSKVQVYKKLDKVWKDVSIQKTAGFGGKWDQSNTVLIDDSKLKALAQPYNLLQVPEYTKQDLPPQGKGQNKKQHSDLNKIQIDIMKGVELKLEELKYQDNVSRLIRLWRTGEAAIPKMPGEKVVIEDTADDKTSPQSCLEVVDDEDGSLKVHHRTSHLPTPQSMADSDELALGSLSFSDDDDKDEGGAFTGLVTDRSASPLNEDVFRELLEGTGK